MAIVGHGPKSGANSSNATSNNRELTAELWVESDDPEDTGHAVLTYLIAQGYRYGAAYNVGNDDLSSRTPFNTALYQIDAPQLAAGSSTMWSVMLHYKLVTRQMQVAGGSGELAPNPVLRRAVLSINSVSRTEAVTRGIYRGGFTSTTGNVWKEDEEYRITNSAKKDVSPIVEIEKDNYVLRAVRNFPRVHVSEITLPGRWVNSTDLVFDDGLLRVTIGKYQLRSLSWSIVPKFEEDTEFLEVTFEGEIKYTEHGWRLDLLDVGFEETQEYSLGPGHVKLLDANGQTPDTPLRLNGQGKKIADQQGPDEFYGIWTVIPEIDIRTTTFFAGLVE
jgi:hypothetical protein